MASDPAAAPSVMVIPFAAATPQPVPADLDELAGHAYAVASIDSRTVLVAAADRG
jgi:hypothetical protein